MIIKIINKITFLINIFFSNELFYIKCRSQNENKENIFLNYLSNFIKNKNFIEVGFHHLEFNCVGLIKKDFKGLMIDGGRLSNILLLKLIVLIIKKDIKVLRKFIITENIIQLLSFKNIGCLSLDIDGNDYWILKKIINENIFPEVIIVEYNASFLDKSISVPYDQSFDRKVKHISGFYHGASLLAFYNLLKIQNYHLVKSIGGSNAVFVNNHIIKKAKLKSFLPSEIYEECFLRNKWSNTTAKQQFEIIKNLKIENV